MLLSNYAWRAAFVFQGRATWDFELLDFWGGLAVPLLAVYSFNHFYLPFVAADNEKNGREELGQFGDEVVEDLVRFLVVGQWRDRRRCPICASIFGGAPGPLASSGWATNRRAVAA